MSELAATGYKEKGRGAVWLSHGGRESPPDLWYITKAEAKELFAGVAGLDPELQAFIAQYDPQEEFVLVEFGPEGKKPRCRVRERVKT